MEVFRLTRIPHASPLSGKGAALMGARWNSTGVELIYTSGNRSLAMAEVAVHLSLASLPSDYVMVTISVPDDISVLHVSESDLPKDWRVFPHPNSTQKIGNAFVAANKYCLMRIPSVVTKGDYNFLINPNHKDFKRIKIVSVEAFPFDNRIFK